MSATETRTAPWLPPAPRAADPPEAATRPAHWLLGAGLGVAVVYAAFADGAIGLSEESNLQLGIALIALLTVAGLASGARLRFSPDRRARLGLWLLAGFAGWCALSITWSLLPEETWIETNRAITYLLVVGLGVVLGSSLPRAAERVAFGYLAIVTVVSLYAVGGKVFPGIFDHAGEITRLRAPLGYWNALALFCMPAVPVAIQAAADQRLRVRRRLGAMLTLVPVLLTIALTYSRGGIVVLVVALAVQIAMAPGRLKLFSYVVVGALAVLPALLVAVIRDDLTTDELSAATRADDGLFLGLAIVVGALIVLAAGRILIQADDLRLSKAGRVATRRAVALVAMLGVAGVVALTATGWTGDQVENFAETDEVADTTDPSRVLQTQSGNRWVWWKEAAGAAWDEPVTGHGAGSFPVVHLAYRQDKIEVRQPHNVPLEFLAETGVVGAALGLGGLALLLMAGLSRTRWRLGGERSYSAALMAATVGYMVHLAFDWDWDIPAVTLPVLIFLGVVAAAPSDREPPTQGAGAGSRTLAVAGAGLLLGLFAVSALVPAVAREKTDRALDLSRNNRPADLRDAAELARLASKLNPFAVDPLFAAAGIANRSGQPREATDLLTEAVERQPDNPRAWLRLAAQLVLIGDLPGANAASRNALVLDPRGLGSRFSALVSKYDERLSASATGTPLPLEVEVTTPTPLAPALAAPLGVVPAPTPTPAPAPVPAPPPAPTPAPAPAPPPDTGGEPFRLEG